VSDKTAERVLVIPTEIFHQAGVFQGFTPRVADYLPGLLETRHLSYRPRAEVETDPTFKQIVPYIVLMCRSQVLHYTSGKPGTETRLQAFRSVGVGGHINPDDRNLFDTPYREAMFREVAEEVEIQSAYTERCIGLINDDSTPVGQVHLGIVHVFHLEEPKVQRREQVLARAGFAPITELLDQRAEFESWSRFVLESGFLEK